MDKYLKPPETWVPKRGGLKPAGKRQESATFLQRSFFDVAVQFFVCCSAAFGPNDFRTAEKPMLQCSFCSAAFRKLQRNFRFRLWHVAGAGFRGVGFSAVCCGHAAPARKSKPHSCLPHGQRTTPSENHCNHGNPGAKCQPDSLTTFLVVPSFQGKERISREKFYTPPPPSPPFRPEDLFQREGGGGCIF